VVALEEEFSFERGMQEVFSFDLIFSFDGFTKLVLLSIVWSQ